MSITVFAYILLGMLALLAAYVVGVSSVEPPLEHYDLEDDNALHWEEAEKKPASGRR